MKFRVVGGVCCNEVRLVFGNIFIQELMGASALQASQSQVQLQNKLLKSF